MKPYRDLLHQTPKIHCFTATKVPSHFTICRQVRHFEQRITNWVSTYVLSYPRAYDPIYGRNRNVATRQHMAEDVSNHTEISCAKLPRSVASPRRKFPYTLRYVRRSAISNNDSRIGSAHMCYLIHVHTTRFLVATEISQRANRWLKMYEPIHQAQKIRCFTATKVSSRVTICLQIRQSTQGVANWINTDVLSCPRAHDLISGRYTNVGYTALTSPPHRSGHAQASQNQSLKGGTMMSRRGIHVSIGICGWDTRPPKVIIYY